MHIFIKSFNRPYYLDRCIESIQRNVIDKDLKIIVLDDGTHPKYLTKIKNKYPGISIKYSPLYQKKVDLIQGIVLNKEAVKKMEIPSEFWLSSIMACNERYFIIIEDDIWFTNKIDVNSVVKLMDAQEICLLKLFHFDNQRMMSGTLEKVSGEISTITPSLVVENPFIFEQIIIKNRFKILSVLRKLGFYNPNSKINYYTIYNVAGAVFSKEYYEYLWKDFKGLVNEDSQLIKAVNYYADYKETKKYAVYNNEIINTSFSSSATNMFDGINLNVFVYNQILNDAWFADEFDVMAGYPLDITDQEIINALEKNANKEASIKEWRKWVNRFKEQFRNVGHTIE